MAIRQLAPSLPNLIANVLGLGWAGNTCGIEGHGRFKRAEEERRSADPMYARSVPEGTASGGNVYISDY